MKIYVADAEGGSRVWVKCVLPKPPEPYQPGLAVDGVVDGRPCKVTLPPEEMVQEERGDMAAVEDLCDLGHVHEASILDVVDARSAAARPYTAAGDVVVAVNPFKWLGIYTPELRALHSAAPSSAEARRSAHCYSVSGAAARGAARGDDQSILVSGESGSGKTETVKIMLQHLADVARHGGATQTIVAQVLRAGPLLESYGNAATLRNGNSSRFAKFLRVEFDSRSMALESSWCETALLEKTRVVERAAGERAFHVFYERLESLKKRGAPAYLPEHPCATADASAAKARGFDDAAAFGEMRESLGSVCRLDEKAIAALLHCVDAVLSLGEVAFADVAHATQDDACAVKDAAALTKAATALGCDRSLLEAGFLQRTVGTSTTALSASHAADARDALAKELYSRLFDRVVELSNATTKRDGAGHGVIIGMLDLFGFEFYGAAGSTNGFEQLLINFANERLQQRFVADVLARAQRELLAEGVPWTRVDYDDNAEVLRLIEARSGLVDILNEECVRGNSGNDVNFVGKLLNNFKEHSCLSTPKIRMHRAGDALPFTIQHYAGAVLYRCTDKAAWVERNRDVLPAKLIEAMTTPAANATVTGALSPVAVFGNAEALALQKARERQRAGGGRARRRGSQLNAHETVGSKFRSQLKELMRQIAATKCRYVRCVRPNDSAKAMSTKGAFDRVAVVEQLRCCGVLAALRVARAGYPDRKPLRAFVERFAVVLPGDGRSTTLQKCRAAADAAGLGDFDASYDGLAVVDDVDAPTSEDLRHGEDEDLVLDRAVVAAALPWKAACEKIVAYLTRPASSSRQADKLKRRKTLKDRVFVGRTKVFLKDGALDDIEAVRAAVCFDRAAAIQALCRGVMQKVWYRRARAAILTMSCALRVALAKRRAAKRRRILAALVSVQARWRGYDVRLVGYLQTARKACVLVQKMIGRPIVARNRCALVRDLKARGQTLDSITARLNRLAGPAAAKDRPRGSAVARAATPGGGGHKKSASKESLVSVGEAEAAKTEATAMREVAAEASKALDDLRKENVTLREKLTVAERESRAWRERESAARQREAVLLAVVDGAKREAQHAKMATARHMSDAAALAGSGEANVAYARFRSKLLQHTKHLTPAMRQKLLAQKRPCQKVTIARTELDDFVKRANKPGLDVLKHNRKGKAERRLLKLTPKGDALFWEKPRGGASRSTERFMLEDCMEVRAAHDVDPDAKGKLVCGTETLRRSLSAKHWQLAFSFVFPTRSVDVSFASAETAKTNLRLFKALVQDIKSTRDRALLLADEEHIAATGNGENGGHKSATSAKFGV